MSEPGWLRGLGAAYGETPASGWPESRDEVVLDSLRRLIALLHVSVLPEAWYERPVTLTDVVDVLCEHLPPNSVGGPDPRSGHGS